MARLVLARQHTKYTEEESSATDNTGRVADEQEILLTQGLKSIRGRDSLILDEG